MGWFDGTLREARLERKAAESEAELLKSQALLSMANKEPADNKAIIFIPIAIALIGGVVAIVMLKKRK